MTFREMLARIREKRREGMARMRAEGLEPATGLRLVDANGRTRAEGRAFSVLAWVVALAYLTPPLVVRGQTFGEMLVGVQFLSASGRRLSPVHVVARHVAPDVAKLLALKLPPATRRGRLTMSLAFRAADIAHALVDRKKRSLMDVLTRTRAIRETVRQRA